MSTIVPKQRASYAFLVWRKSKGRPPRFRHETREQAEAEAARLANDNPGAAFLVMQELCTYMKVTPPAPSREAAEPGGLQGPRRSPGSPDGGAKC